MSLKPTLLQTLKSLQTSNIKFIEAFVISANPLTLQAVTDNALIINDDNLLPLGERFSTVKKEAVIYAGDEEKSVQIEIDNNIRVDDLFIIIQFDTGETCKYLVLDKI
jgi:hypothetical protein